ncbi:MAG TPA: biotin/lipoyl-containing protein, partial [Streptosporangiaceae bacterium]|nr:biotin/lipoyl-containing protein [Streptosporangiaceae bacterium]
LIVTGATRAQALERARRALAEFEIDGMPTVLPFHRAVVCDPAFTSEPFRVHTRWIETEFAATIPPYSGDAAGAASDAEPRERITVEVGGKRLEVTVPAGLGSGGGASAAAARPKGGARRGGAVGGAVRGGQSGDELVSPMQGTIVKIVAADGEQVAVGDTIVVLEAMKMEQPLTAHKAGVVTGLSISVGQTVPAGAVICQLR